MKTGTFNNVFLYTVFPAAASIFFLLILVVAWNLTPMFGGLPQVDLPFAPSADYYYGSERDIHIVILPDGRLFVGPLVSSLQKLTGILRNVHDRTPDRAILILADRTVRFGDILRVLACSRDAGFSGTSPHHIPRLRIRAPNSWPALTHPCCFEEASGPLLSPAQTELGK